GLVVVAAPSVLVFPQVLQAARLLSDGAIGAVRSATAQFLGGRPPWDGYESDPSPFFSAGAGPLVDIGVYPLHTLTGLLGPVELVSAISARTQQSFVQPPSPGSVGRTVPVEVDDVWHLLMRHVGGAVSSVRSDFATHGSTASPDVEINGDCGSIALSLMDMQAPVRLWSGAESTALPSQGVRVEGPDHILGVQHLIDCVAGMPPVLTVDHAAHVLDILNAAADSSRTGRQVSIGALGWT
ncbi:MAG: Gfo/Idh/MocA family oxidoreductase, partial [Acidimicrobiia bacterium]|nr:Gfo/Idh/MocA family oxidoreductase [Acidimicrobiia bacterium]